LKGGFVIMRKLFFSFLLFGFLIAGVSAQDSNDTMVVRADIVKSSIGISVPESVFFGDITSGYISERQSVDINNIGTVDIRVVPELEEGYDGEYFDYLGFRKILDDPLEMIGYFEIEVEKPASVGGVRNQNVYMYLDLTDYPGEIETNVDHHEAEVIFWAFAI